MKPDHADEIIAQWQRELPEIAGLALELSKRVMRLNALFDAASAQPLEELQLTRAEYAVLATLRRIGAPYRQRPTELASGLSLTSGGVSNLLRRLVEMGLVTRVANTRDARSSAVQLTPRGVKVAELAVRHSITAHEELLARLPKKTARLLSNTLREVLVALGDVPAPATRAVLDEHADDDPSDGPRTKSGRGQRAAL